MSLNAKEAQGGNGNTITPLEAGTYPARLVQVVDMGLQPQRPYQGEEKKPANEILLTYEFVDEFMKDEDGNDIPDKPRWISENMPLFNLNADRAKSTLRYMAFDPTVDAGGDWAKLVGMPVNVTIVQNPGKGKNSDRVYENVAGISAMRAKDKEKCPALINEPVSFNLDEPDMDIFLHLPKWVKDKVMTNMEYKGSTLDHLIGSQGEPAKEDVSGDQPSDTEALTEEENPY